eukprot:scaffold182536_cov36-Tisochrysis_lutea.AAC.3
MGCGVSTASHAPMRQLVLLGGGECGKTTIFKQIQILYGTGFEQTSMDWIYAIHRAPARAVKVVLQAVKNRSEEYSLSEANAVRARAGEGVGGELGKSADADHRPSSLLG